LTNTWAIQCRVNEYSVDLNIYLTNSKTKKQKNCLAMSDSCLHEQGQKEYQENKKERTKQMTKFIEQGQSFNIFSLESTYGN
jgi:hypothetical protein